MAESPTLQAAPLLQRVRVRHYKSIARCRLGLAPLTVVTGRNGAGKSNFLDALRFVVDALGRSLDHAVSSRGGIDEVRRRSTGHPRNFAIELDLSLGDEGEASYGFEIAPRDGGGFAVVWERLRRRLPHGGPRPYFERDAEAVVASATTLPPVLADRLYLVHAAGLPDFRPVYDALTSIAFHRLRPAAMRELQSPDGDVPLRPDGGNLAGVFARLAEPAAVERRLSAILPELNRLERVAFGPRETLCFWQRVKGAEHPWRFYAASMSDGTLRALALLVAAGQAAGERPPSALVVEQVETALHPAAQHVVLDALRTASRRVQVILTTHSGALLDQLRGDDRLIVAASHEGTTQLAATGAEDGRALRAGRATAEELVRAEQDAGRVAGADPRLHQMPLFRANAGRGRR